MSSARPVPPSPDRSRLRADCSSCAALCCTALGFRRSADFPVDKPAGIPCANLDEDSSCRIHDALRPRGFTGCTVFDCFGAGQYVTQELFGAASWRDDAGTATAQFRVFALVRRLHELVWYLAEATERSYDPETLGRIDAVRTRIEQGLATRHTVLALDVESVHDAVRDLLVEVSAEVRGGYADDPAPGVGPGADLAGTDLRGRGLCGRDLRGSVLIGADLRGCDLTDTDLLGADVRGARFEGADLSRALFVTQTQVGAAQGDDETRLPESLDHPSHWRG
jgi:uncharacterized protein YjbI with pentapeptide repeats